MHVSVGIVGFRNADDIVRCLAALGRSSYRQFDVVVVENGGPAAFDALLAVIPAALPGGQPVRVLLAPGNLGFAGGVNACHAAAPDADAWWTLNPDTQPDPEALQALVARLSLGDCDAVGGVLYDSRLVQSYGGQWRGWAARAVSLGRDRSLDDAVAPAPVEARMNYISGASLLAGRRFLAVAGPMRDDYFLYAEEVEWCLRAGRRGMRLGFAPTARVRHGQGSTTGSAESILRRPRLPIYLDERNKLLVVRDTQPLLLPVAALVSLGLTFLRFGRRRAWTQWGYALDGWLAGLCNRRGQPAWLTARN